MRRRTKIYINPKHVLIICIILCISLIAISFRFSDEMNPVKEAVGSAVTPMQRGINIVGTFISDQLDNFKSTSDLLDENAKLKDQLDIMSYENKLLLQDKNELDALRKLYDLDQKYIDYPKVAARVISKDSDNWYNIFKIDKGTRDGLAVNNNVIAGNGLVGIITEAHYNYSIVRSIIDDNSNVSGMISRTADECYVKGDLKLLDQGKILVELIDMKADIHDGDEVVTAHISDKFFEGILIGTISDIKTDPSNMSRTAYLTPVVDFAHLEEVLIITDLKEPLID